MRHSSLVFAWGENKNGQLGAPLATRRSPTPVQAGQTVRSYAVGNTSFAVKTDGTVWWWGGVALVNRMSAPLGRNRNVPTLITLP